MADACTQGVDIGFVALGYAKVALLGVVQGITELLPISSTAHMRVVPALLGWQDPGSAFSAAMQLAALAQSTGLKRSSRSAFAVHRLIVRKSVTHSAGHSNLRFLMPRGLRASRTKQPREKLTHPPTRRRREARRQAHPRRQRRANQCCASRPAPRHRV
jgi:hypothetical protein